jgi:hypothetical protein
VTKVERRKIKEMDQFQIIIHIYMEMSQENSLYCDLKQTKMSIFFFYRIGEQEGRTGPAWGRGWLVSMGGSRMWEKGVGG